MKKNRLHWLCPGKNSDNIEVLQISNVKNISENIDNLKINNDEDLCRTKSAEDIFTDIKNQCVLLTGSQEKV